MNRGITPISQIVWGVLIWNGLKQHTHGGVHYLEKNFGKKIWSKPVFVYTFGGWVGMSI